MNGETNLFNPVDLDTSRSTFVGHPTRSGTCNAGRLIPVFWMEVQPGDSIKLDVRSLFKMSTPVYPTMDELFADVAFYFVPNKLTYGVRYGSPSTMEGTRSWKGVIGAQTGVVNVPVPQNGSMVPVLKSGDSPVAGGGLMDYLMPGFSDTWSELVSALPAMAYFAIWNENYRDPNTMEMVTWNIDLDSNTGKLTLHPYGDVPLYATVLENDGNTTGQPDYVLVNALNARHDGHTTTAQVLAEQWNVFPTCRFHGYFGSALPWPQRNAVDVTVPLGSWAPVTTLAVNHKNVGDSVDPLHGVASIVQSDGSYKAASISDNRPIILNAYTTSDKNGLVGARSDSSGTAAVNGFTPSNLWADLSQAQAANINALRAAFAQQRWYEHLARSGNSYDSLEYGLFGVRPKDSGLERPLYLGGKRIPLNITMVASTNGGDTTSGQSASGSSVGQLGAFSHTNDQDHFFYHSFDDWGVLMCVFTIRHHTTPYGGLLRSYTRLKRDQMYFPTFAHLGEQAISKAELTGDSDDVGSVFGYQEAWAEYRQWPDQVTGLLAPSESLAFMTYAEAFVGNTSLATFVNASYQVESVDKTLQVASTASGFQFVYQMTFDIVARRCMPTYSFPGLIDHC